MKTKRSKLYIMFALLAVSVLIFGACAENNSTDTQTQDESVSETTEELMLTLQELEAYNGENGAKAYVAYEGVIYDVTGVTQWKTGSHGGNMVGTDITEKLNSAPHGVSKLDEVMAVGKIVE